MEKTSHTFSWKKFFKIIFGVIAAYIICFLLLVLALRWVNPPFTAFTLQENWEELNSESYNLRNHWIPAKELPEHLKLAAISSEDQNFWQHWGLDIEAIQEAVNENDRGEKRRGASTITQQVAKNLFLTSSQTYFRKALEAGIAVLIEAMWPKERILEIYLNIAEMGPGTFGAGKATTQFFEKNVSGLVPEESARLAAVLPSPKRMRVEPASPFVEERSRWILLQMTHLSGISYLPKPEPVPEDDSRQIAADTTQFERNQPQIGRARIPDSLIQISERDPLLDSVWEDSLNGWQ